MVRARRRRRTKHGEGRETRADLLDVAFAVDSSGYDLRAAAMNNAELIVATLRAAGVSHGFGIPSGNVLPLIEAMRVGRLPYVLTAHEGSAAFMADVMGRLTGAPGLCIATLGPGATNLTTGVGMPTSIARRSWRSRAICRRRSS